MSKLQVKPLAVGELKSNCYLVYDDNSKKTLIIDPGDEAIYISTIISDLKLIPIQMIATHGHFDHILAAFELQVNYSVSFAAHKNDLFLIKNLKKSSKYFLKRNIYEEIPNVNKFIKNRDLIKFGNQNLKVINTPGHTPGSICLYNRENNILFSGDTLFDIGIGRTDFSYSSEKDMQLSLKSIFKLPPNTRVFPGHGKSFNLCDNPLFADSFEKR